MSEATRERCAHVIDGTLYRCHKRVRRDGYCKRHAAERRTDAAIERYRREQERERLRETGCDPDERWA